MILQELYKLYERKLKEKSDEVSPPGFEKKEIPYLVVMDEKGNFVRFESTVFEADRTKRARSFFVPAGVKRSSGISANLLWDNLGYVLGIPDGEKETDKSRLTEQKKAFYKRIKELYKETQEKALEAVLSFSEVPISVLKKDPLWREITESKTGANLTFKIHSDADIICAKDTIQKHVTAAVQKSEGDKKSGHCLITGEHTEIERLHPAIKGVQGAQPTGANIVSYNLSAFTSFGKEQSFNAPTGKYAAFAYTTALNTLLARDSQQKLQIGDATVVFWSEKDSKLEKTFGAFFAFDVKGSEAERQNIASVKALLEAAKKGSTAKLDKGINFYVLALAPNASRLAIRFWYQESVAQIEKNLVQYFTDLRMMRPHFLETDVLPLQTLLESTAVLHKKENIHPLMATELFKAILTNRAFPRIVLLAVIGRIRAEPETEPKYEYCRAALLKAYINRLIRFQGYKAKELEEKMDEKNTNAAYRLGRLFAVFEYLQAKAIGNPNASIRDRYYASASSRPAIVFPVLVRLANYHIARFDERVRVWADKLIQDILSSFPAENAFPKIMTLEEQGLFAVGYYQQKQALFSRKEDRETENTPESV